MDRGAVPGTRLDDHRGAESSGDLGGAVARAVVHHDGVEALREARPSRSGSAGASSRHGTTTSQELRLGTFAHRGGRGPARVLRRWGTGCELLRLGAMTTSGRPHRAPLAGVFVAVGLAGLAMALPALTGWDVHVRYFPPLHAEWDPRTGSRHASPPLLVGALAVWFSVGLAERLSVARAAALDVRRGAGVAVQPRPGRRRREGDRHDPRRRVRVPPHRASDDGPPRDAEGVRLAHPLRRPPRRHRPRQLAGARRRPPARRAELLRAARPDRSRRRPAGGHRGHAARRARPRSPYSSPCACSAPRWSPAAPRRSWSSRPPRSGRR